MSATRVLWICAGACCLLAAWALLRPGEEASANADPSAAGAPGAEAEERPFFLHANWDASAKAPARRRAGGPGENRDPALDEAWERLQGVEFALPAPEEKK